ncbi:hypothetical protein HYU22_01885 [Candidatus Woesearchaeota archaeon]|nr:hypothetical protein [Candidatus Woesearchaeota archaeon]
MHKKLTAQGPRDRKSYTVTLPLDWVKEHQLDKTKHVELETLGSKVIISAETLREERQVVNLSLYPQTPLKVLQNLYRMGVSEIKVMYTSPSQLQEVATIVNMKLIGCEIIEQGKNYAIIKDITKESTEDFETIIRRIFLLILELTTVKDVTNLAALENTIQKLVNYCLRMLVLQGHVEYTKTPFYVVLLDRLEKLTDEYSWILKTRPTPEQAKALLVINKYIRKAYELYYTFNPQEFDAVAYQTYQRMNDIKGKPHVTIFEMHLHNLARQLNTICSTIFILRYTASPKSP